MFVGLAGSSRAGASPRLPGHRAEWAWLCGPLRGPKHWLPPCETTPMVSPESIPVERLSHLHFDKLQLFSRYRRHRVFTAEDLLAIAKAEFRDAAEQGVAFGLVREGALLGLCVVRPLDWDSSHFGLSMGRLMLSAAPGVDDADLDRLVQSTLREALPVLDLWHLSCEVDIDDYACLNALLRARFDILDIKRTWCTTRLRPDIDVVRNVRSVRPYRATDLPVVREMLADIHFPSRFSRDPLLSPGLVSTMYEKWFHRLLEQSLAGDALAMVFERQGRVVACGAVDEVDFGFAGLGQKMMSGGLYACTRGGVGGYAPVMHTLISESVRRNGIGDTTASLNNTAVARVLEGFRSYSGSVIRYALRLNASART